MERFKIVPFDDGFRLVGELDIGTVSELEEALESWGTARPLTLDMSELSFMDASTARALLRHAAAMDGGGELVLDGPTGLPLRVLEVLDFDQVPGIRVRSVSVVRSDG